MSVICCPMCSWSKSETWNGPKYKPARWYRKRPFWVCTWCKYEWEDEADFPDEAPTPTGVSSEPAS